MKASTPLVPRGVADAMEASSAEFRRRAVKDPSAFSLWTKLFAANQTMLSAMTDGSASAALLEICSNLLGCEEVAVVEIERKTGVVRFVTEVGISPRNRAALINNPSLLQSRIVPGSSITSDNGKDTGPLSEVGISALVPLWADQHSTAAMVLFQLLPHRSGFDAEDREVLRLLSIYAGPCLRAKVVDKRAATARKAVALGVPGDERATERAAAPAELLEIYLHPGQIDIATSPVILKMILGSCVGVFLVDAVAGIGAATHFMLPQHGSSPASPRYGDVAITDLLQRMRAAGSKAGNMQAKVFGGASMLVFRDLPASGISRIGQRNVETAMEILGKASVPVGEKDVLGNHARKVSMVSNTGEIKLEFVSAAHGI